VDTSRWFTRLWAWGTEAGSGADQSQRMVRVATGGLALVLIALTTFSVWATVVTNRSTGQVLGATQRNDVYQQARLALATEQQLERDYHRNADHPDPALRRRFDEAAASLDRSLGEVRAITGRAGSAEAARLARTEQLIQTDHERYRQVVDSSFALAEAGDPQGALQIHDQLAGAAFTRVTDLIEAASAAERKNARESVAALHRLENSLMVITPLIFGVGLLLVVCWRIVVGYQRTLQRQAAENAEQARQLELARERERLAELSQRHAQKLESVGRLAAGIAHEINTPIQFVGDNIRFLRDAFADLLRLRDAYQEVGGAAGDRAALDAALAEVARSEIEIDLEFLIDEVPQAIDHSIDGVGRVATIVGAMKAFGYTNNEEKAPVDLNEAIRNTLVVANSELKYVADVRTDLRELPRVWCHVGDLNQVVLNLAVNAAHAIAAAGDGRPGMLTVSTRLDGDEVVIDVADTGTGMPPDVAEKVFEPFFTTKEVGTGTGQGLALIRSLVVERHGGAITFVTEPGVGTTFSVRIPVAAPEQEHGLAASGGAPGSGGVPARGWSA
jgi:signal transduction histidine kinase